MGRVASGGDCVVVRRLGCTELSSSDVDGSDRVFPVWEVISGSLEGGFGIDSSVVMGGISRVVFVMWIVREVM